MGPLFINLDKDFEMAKRIIFDALGLEHILEGDSLNVLNGTYFEAGVFGMYIKLEQNSYEYEDDFNYTLFVDRDYSSSVKLTRDIEETMLNLVMKLLLVNLNIKIGIEKNNSLQIISP